MPFIGVMMDFDHVHALWEVKLKSKVTLGPIHIG